MYPIMRPQDRVPNVDQLRASIDGLCVPGVLTAVVQPIVSLSDLSVVGYEALPRVPAGATSSSASFRSSTDLTSWPSRSRSVDKPISHSRHLAHQ
jgi:hypothetical protein